MFMSDEEFKSLSREKQEEVEKEERDDLVKEFVKMGVNPTEPVFGLQMDQSNRRWRILPLGQRIRRRVRWSLLKIPLFD
jgi:hypothetical protein